MTGFPHHSKAARELLSLPRFGNGIGLHRMLWLLEQLPEAEWLANLDVLKITGSKGKGSTSALCEAILASLGLEVGLYTSPHLLRFNERIRMTGSDITDQALSMAWMWLKDSMAKYNALHAADFFGSFEAFTAIAFSAFANTRMTAVVSEAGIGGRFDPTRVLPGRTVVLTSIELEHQQLLGNTTELIAYDKADLCPFGGTLVVGKLEHDLLRRLKSYCLVRGINLVDVGAESEISDVKYFDDMMEFSLKCIGRDFGRVATPLWGEHQARNAAAAISATWNWVSRNRPDSSADTFQAAVVGALATVQWPGRLQRILAVPEVIIDVGHTPQSMRCIADTMRTRYPTKQIALLTGVSRDKDIAGILRELTPLAGVIVCTRPYHKGAPADEVAVVCRSLRPDIEVFVIERIEEAVRATVSLAAERDMIVLVAGGLFLSIEAMVAVQDESPSDLQFA